MREQYTQRFGRKNKWQAVTRSPVGDVLEGALAALILASLLVGAFTGIAAARVFGWGAVQP